MAASTRVKVPVLIIIAVVVAIAIATVIIMSLAMPRQTGPVAEKRPSAKPVVEAYLTAIATGDAETAREMDAAARGHTPFLHNDQDSFLTDEVLAAATERISEVTVKDLRSTQDKAVVQAGFTLDGELYQPTFSLEWNEITDDWQLRTTVANQLQVVSLVELPVESPEPTEPVVPEAAPFTLAGIEPIALANADDDTELGYLAYPGVYELEVGIDEDRLVDADKTPVSRELVVRPYVTDGAARAVQFAVSY